MQPAVATVPAEIAPFVRDTSRLPYPVAITAQRFIDALDSSSDVFRTVNCLKDCFEATIKFLGAVLLADYFRSSAATSERNALLLEKLVRPSLGVWVRVVVGDVSRWLIDAKVEGTVGRAVAALFFHPLAPRSAKPKPTQLMERCEQFVTYRNETIGHGAMRTDAAYERDLQDWHPMLCELLSGVERLGSYRLKLVTSRASSSVWMGTASGTITEAGAFDESLIEHFVLCPATDSETAGQDQPVNDLFPFLCYLPDREQQRRLHFYDSIRRYQETRKEVEVLEYDTGFKCVSPEPIFGLERLLTPELLAKAFKTHQGRMESIEGRVAGFGELLIEQVNFVGRKFVISAVERFIEENDRGLFVIEAEPGKGKTALMRHLINEVFGHYSPQPIHFFYRRTNGITDPDVCVRTIYHALLASHELAEGDDWRQETSPEKMLGKLNDLLSKKIAPRLSPSRPQLIFIDALDEAERTETGKDAIQRIPETLPKGVYVIVTTRKIPNRARLSRRSHVHWYDLDSPDLLQDNLRDGTAFVRRELKDCAVPNETVKEIARIGAGNFLVLTQLVNRVRESSDPGSVDDLLRRIATGPANEQLRLIYEDFWERLTGRLKRDETQILCDVAGLLVTARNPMSTEMICDCLPQLRSADWDFALRHLMEYLTVIPIEEEDEQKTFYRVYHESFAEFLRVKVSPDRHRLESVLANYCRHWNEHAPGRGRLYALRFGPDHLVSAAEHDPRHWPELVEILTDLSFIEARFVAAQGYDLLEDYDRALRNHPETGDQFRSRYEQDERLRQWVEELVDYSQNCTAIRGRYAHKDISGSVAFAEVQKVEFPEPIGTSATITAMRKAEEAQHTLSSGCHSSDAATSLFEFRSFVRSQFDDLNEVPHSTFGIASSFAADGPVADAVRRTSANCESAPILRRTIPPPYLRSHSMVVTRIGCGIEADEQNCGWMTPDARVGVGYPCEGASFCDIIWNLRSGRELWGADRSVNVLGITIDGKFAALNVSQTISHHEDSDNDHVLQLVELSTERIICETVYCSDCLFFGRSRTTPDGSLVVFWMQGSNQLVVWNTAENQTDSLIDLGKIEPKELVVCLSGMVAATAHTEGDRTFWTFIDIPFRHVIDDVVADSELEQFLAGKWFGNDWSIARRLQQGTVSADGTLHLGPRVGKSSAQTVLQTIQRSNGSIVRRFDASFPFGELKCISADGRFGIADRYGDIHLLDLENGVWEDGNPAGGTPDGASQSATETINSPYGDRPVTARRFSDEELLAAELQFDISQRPGCVLLSPDGSYLFSDHRSTSQSEVDLGGSDPHDIGDDEENTDSSSAIVPAKKQYIAAMVTDLSNQDHFEIKGPRRMLTVTRDGSVVVFTGDCDRHENCRSNQLTFWSVDRQDWLPAYQLNSHFEPESFGCDPISPLHPRALQSPDGRVLLLGNNDQQFFVRLNGGHQKTLPQRRWKNHEPRFSWFSPDGKYLVQMYGDTAYLWTVPQGECIGVVEGPEFSETDPRWPSWIDCEGVLQDNRDQDFGIRIDDPKRSPAWVTGARLFRSHSANGDGSRMRIADSWEVVRKRLSGLYEPITFLCPVNRKRAELPDKVIKTIDAIRANSRVRMSSVLELPDEAWDDGPDLNFPCPVCHQTHRSTPFYVDRQKSQFHSVS